jgi:hypothetical protein
MTKHYSGQHNNTQLIDTQNNDIKHNDTQLNWLNYNTQHSILWLSYAEPVYWMLTALHNNSKHNDFKNNGLTLQHSAQLY